MLKKIGMGCAIGAAVVCLILVIVLPIVLWFLSKINITIIISSITK